MPGLIDNPLVLQLLFHPRSAQPDGSSLSDVHDGTIPAGDAEIGYRLYVRTPESPLMLFFHGNGEIASDYDGLASLYHDVGVSLLVIDYRGYGWSTGKPLISTLLPDAENALDGVPDILENAGITTGNTWLIKGRSLGSVPAVHLAHKHPERFKGLVIESGMADLPSLFRQLGVGYTKMTGMELPFNNARKMPEVDLPLLVIHGERDMILPVENGQQLYDASPAADKTIVRIPGAGHNDLLLVAVQRYFDAVRAFVQRVTSG
jgi:uncharacterized protein